MDDKDAVEAQMKHFSRKLRDNMQEEPPEIRRKVEENIWDLFHDEGGEPDPKLSITVELDEDGDWMAYDHYHAASAFADTPADALRELATVIELYEQEESGE